MASKVFILVEGIADIVFIKDFIELHHNYQLISKIKDSKTIEIELYKKDSDKYITIYQLEGKNPDSNVVKRLEQRLNNYEPENLLAIFDADENYGLSIKNLESIFSSFQNYDESNIFLFPNNNDDGDLESFLENIVIENKIIECWEGFEHCINNLNKSLSIPAKKSKIHTYLEVLNDNSKEGKKLCKEVNRDYKDKSKWKLDDVNVECVRKLKLFLDNYL